MPDPPLVYAYHAPLDARKGLVYTARTMVRMVALVVLLLCLWWLYEAGQMIHP